MAAIAIPAPGTRLGPCVRKCKHADCASQRRMAASACRMCDERIGYDRRFYQDPEAPPVLHALIHAECLEANLDRERERRANG